MPEAPHPIIAMFFILKYIIRMSKFLCNYYINVLKSVSFFNFEQLREKSYGENNTDTRIRSKFYSKISKIHIF